MDTESPQVEDDGAEFAAWIEHGVAKGWISAPFCGTHDVAPMTPEEDKEFEDGFDPCSGLVRIWPKGKPGTVLYGREGW